LKRSYIVTLIIAAVLLADQALKIYIKTTFYYNQEVSMFGIDRAYLHFVENEGMAFGITLDWKYGKLLLSLFRIGMVAGLIWYIRMLLKADAPRGFVYSVGLITAGAIGNIIDSAFYGLIFTESSHGELAQLVPPGQGYGTFLHGKVVDMFYFPITWIHFPDWLPFWGGDEMLFFSPIFNIADASITCGVAIILLFQRAYFKDTSTEEAETNAEHTVADNAEDAHFEMLDDTPASANRESATNTAVFEEIEEAQEPPAPGNAPEKDPPV
jgi:signal peptidase II